MSFHPQCANRKQTLASKPLVRHTGLGRQGFRQMPIRLTAQGSENRLTFARTERNEVSDLGACATPLCPVAHAHASSQPPIEFRHGAVVVRYAEVVHPASEVLCDAVASVANASKQPQIYATCMQFGLVPPTICAPLQLLEV